MDDTLDSTLDNNNLEFALKDPETVAVSELDTLLQAQLKAIQSIKALQNTQSVTEKSPSATPGKKRRALKHFNNRI